MRHRIKLLGRTRNDETGETTFSYGCDRPAEGSVDHREVYDSHGRTVGAVTRTADHMGNWGEFVLEEAKP